MTLRIEFSIDANPEPWRRARVKRVGRFVRHFQDSKTRGYEAAVEFAARCAMGENLPMTGPVAVVLVFSMPIPPSWRNRKAVAARLGEIRPVVAPDVDNLAKAILDGCNGVVFADDKQVVKLTASKIYADRGGITASFEEIAQ